MQDSSKNNVKSTITFILNFAQILCFSLVVGGVGGLIGGAFHRCIDSATEMRNNNPAILFLMPVGGLFIVAMYKIFAKDKNVTTDLIISSLRKDQKIPVVMMPLIFIGTVVTQFVGGTAGREGAALQLGGSLGYNTGKLFKLNTDKSHVLIMTGMSSVFSALFGTPLTAALFSIEVSSVGLLDYTALLPCFVAAIASKHVSSLMGNHAVSFPGISFDSSFSSIIGTAVLSVLCALMSILFCVVIKRGTKYIKKLISNDFLRVIVCSIVLIGATLLLGTYDYNGAGMFVVERAMSGKADTFAFILKLLFTAVSLAAGFKGGEIVPAFFVGSTFGCVMAPLLGLDPAVGAAIGFVALFCGVVNCPLASLLLSIEVFGTEGLMLFAISCAVSYLLSGYFSLYPSQRFIYSKSDARYIIEAEIESKQ